MKKKKGKAKSVINTIRLGLGNGNVRIFLMAIVAACVVILIADANTKDEKQKIVEKVTEEAVVVEEPEEEEEEEPRIISVDFDKLHEVNPDIYAWLMVPGTNVNYPILQSPEGVDTDYYLETNIDGTTGLPGSIYTQRRNAKDFSDRDTVVYGHDMKNGTMFKTLHNFEDEEFFNTNRYIYVYTPDESYVYRIFAAISYDDRLILDYYNDFQDENVFAEYLDDIKTHSGNVDTNEVVTKDDRIITLSTCIATAPNSRYLVIGKLLSDEEVEALGETTLDAADDNAKAGQTNLTGEDAEEETNPEEGTGTGEETDTEEGEVTEE